MDDCELVPADQEWQTAEREVREDISAGRVIRARSVEELVEKLKLRDGKYCTIIISDFTVNKIEVCVMGDVVRLMQEIGFQFCGNTVLLQPVKPLFPFGYPYAYKINHHHQNIITFRRPKALVTAKD